VAEEIEIRVRGRRFAGWKEVQIFRSMEHVAGGFEITMHDLSPRAAVPGQPIEIYLGTRDRLLRGYVDRVKARMSSREARIQGRDRTSDLVDNSAGLRPGEGEALEENLEYLSIRLERLVRSLAEPFGIEVLVTDVDATTFIDKFAVEPGETAWASIERACRQLGILAFSNGDGNLVLARPGNQHATRDLVQGENVLDAELDLSLADRHSVYIVKAQRRGQDDEFGSVVAAVEGRASDSEIDRFRPLLVLSEAMSSSSSAESRAQWEATVRAARGAQIFVETQGLREFPSLPTTPIWQPNRTVRARLPKLSLDSEFLIASVRLTSSERGKRARIRLVRPDAYTPKEEVEVLEGGFQEYLREWEAVQGGTNVPASFLEEDEDG